MKRIEIEVGDWEHDCCGPEVRRHTEVRWTVIPAVDGPWTETHHDLTGIKTVVVAGTVVELEALQEDGSRIPITHLPSGPSLRKMGSGDRGDIIELHTGRVVDRSEGGFIVTVEVED
ncbi:hypothetical protein BKA24_002877 [Microbacterium marinum]|uniref:Uncharacterized protein n=1 Tax=Microbacterium marinum TaxID=421115 RepID=A0A7W7FKI6_9MICO|nr:hypothetical protein [Microbacterium marinum]MBB4668168.1 hypothetical protein [Microbacterium marinum]